MKNHFVKLASIFAPSKMTDLAYEQLTNPQVRKLRDFEIDILDKAQKNTLEFKGFKIQTYKWGSGSREVLLIHGWEGQAGNFGNIVDELLKNDYTVHAFDGPSHGFSSKGNTSLFEFVELVSLLIEELKVKLLVSHSFGGVATTFALNTLPEISIDKYVLLTTPDKFSERIDDVAAQVGITEKVKNNLIKRFQKEIGQDPMILNVSNIVEELDVKKAIILHDKNDRVIPIERSKNVYENWTNCQFQEIEGTGHFRILREPHVIEKVIHFLEN